VHKRPIAAAYPVPQVFTKEQSAAMHVGYAAQNTVKEIRAKKAKMTTVDKQVLQTTLISCSTGTEAEDKVLLAQQAEFFGYRGTNGRIKFRNNFVKPKLKIKATDNRSLQVVVERKTRSDRIDGDPIFEKLFEENADQVKGKRGTKRKSVGCEVVEVGGKRKRQVQRVEHAARIRSMSIKDIQTLVLWSEAYREWKADPDNKAKVRGLLKNGGDGDILQCRC
jgi:hypothetical protein